jgi:hypothetical protein
MQSSDTAGNLSHQPVLSSKCDDPDIPDDAGRWIRVVAEYRGADHARSMLEIAITAVPLILLWVAMWWSLSVSYLLCLALAVPAAGFLVRLFMIQHDCGHGSFFRQRHLNDCVGSLLGVITLTPYHFWKRTHGIHHASSPCANISRCRNGGALPIVSTGTRSLCSASGRHICSSFSTAFPSA